MGLGFHRFNSCLPVNNIIRESFFFNAGLILKKNDVKKIKLGYFNIKDLKVKFYFGTPILYKKNFKRVLLLRKNELILIKNKINNGRFLLIPLKFFVIRNIIKITLFLSKKSF